MMTAFDGPLAIVTDREPRSRSQLLLASALNVIFCRPDAQAWHSALRACTEALLSGRRVLVLEEPRAAQIGGDRANSAWVLACEAWSSAFPGQLPVVLPVTRFYPCTRHQEIWIHVGGRVALDVAVDAQVDAARSHLRPMLGEAGRGSVFALEDSLLEELFADVQQALQSRLQERWQARPAWNQNADGFRLSSCAIEALRRINQHEPGTVVALLELCEIDRESRRLLSLAGLRAGLGRQQLSAVKWLLRWTESVVGLPLACWALLNHLVPALLLYMFGLAKRDQQVKAETWLARALAVLVGYGGQIALVDHLLGRAAAGYYALTLPPSGAYLFRYRWLLQQRPSIPLLGVKAVPLRSVGRVRRKKLFETLDQMLAVKSPAPPLGSP